jgi:hypothetical protein
MDLALAALRLTGGKDCTALVPQGGKEEGRGKAIDLALAALAS